MEQLRVLVVEHDLIARRQIVVHLEQANVAVHSLSDARSALQLLAEHQFDVLVIDMNLPDESGTTVMEAARRGDGEIEIIALTHAGSLDTARAAINHGACDYLQKPAAPEFVAHRVLAAGIRCQSRRQLRRFYERLHAHTATHTPHLHTTSPMIREPRNTYMRSFGPLLIDANRRTVTCAQRRSDLSSGEMKLLLYLADHPERVIGVRQIVRDVFGYECNEIEARDLVKARVHMLRRKIEPDPRTPQLLVSVRGAGYVLTTQHFE